MEIVRHCHAERLNTDVGNWVIQVVDQFDNHSRACENKGANRSAIVARSIDRRCRCILYVFRVDTLSAFTARRCFPLCLHVVGRNYPPPPPPRPLPLSHSPSPHNTQRRKVGVYS